MTVSLDEVAARYFARLERYCAAHDIDVESSGKPRWVSTNQSGDEDNVGGWTPRSILLKGELAKMRSVELSRSSRIVFFSSANHCDSDDFFVAIGIDPVDLPECLTVEPLTSRQLINSILKANYLQVEIYPMESAPEVRNVIDVDWKDRTPDSSYVGHDHRELLNLHGPVWGYTIPSEVILDSGRERINLAAALEISRSRGTWIDDVLYSELYSVSVSSIVGLSGDLYGEMASAVLGSDPRMLFLSIYKALEGIYSFRSVKSLKEKLRVNLSWRECAKYVSDELNWNPREEESIVRLFEGISEEIVEDLARQLKLTGEVTPAGVARDVYKKRNSIVHYRIDSYLDLDGDIDWNGLCVALLRVVASVVPDSSRD